MNVETEVIVKNAIRIWSKVSTVPKLLSGKIVQIDENSATIASMWQFHDLQRRKLVSTARTYVIKNLDKVADVSRIVNEVPTSCISYHPTSGIQVSLKTEGDAQFLEIWNETRRTFFMDVSECKEHGKINTKSPTVFQWYKNKLLYLAESKRKDVSLFKYPMESPNFELSANMIHEFDYEEDWGETMDGNHHPMLCIFDTETFNVTVENPKEKVSIGEAVWAPDGSVVFIGYNEEPYRLGQAACLNRKSGVYRYDTESGITELLVTPKSSSEDHIRSARFAPNGRFLVYLQNSSNGCHQKCSQLALFDWHAREQRIVIDIVQQPISESDFPGIFTSDLPIRCFSSDSSHVFFTSLWHGEQKVIAVNIEDGRVFDVTEDWGCCAAVLDVYQDNMIILCEKINEEPFLKFGKLQLTKGKVTVQCCNLDADAPAKVTHVNSIPLPLDTQVDQPCWFSDMCHVLLCEPKPVSTDSRRPLIIWIHGGPHACFTSNYNPLVNGFIELGFAVAMINYRGSTGYGEKSINSLAGKIGDQDVSDVQLAISRTKEFMTKRGYLIDNVFIFGGSHGGFLGAHMCAQCPGEFSACVLRNPVTNVATMTEISDIPDWCFSESGLDFDFDSPTLEQQQLMYSKSPLKDVKKVVTPTLLLLGKKDRRVPYSQGLNYYHNLKKNNVEVKVCVYDDGHALKTVPADADGFVQTAIWFLSHMRNG